MLAADGRHRQTLTGTPQGGILSPLQPVAALLEALGVTQNHYRPHSSNGHPFSEAPCKTLQHRPDCPDRFPTMAVARRFLRCITVPTPP